MHCLRVGCSTSALAEGAEVAPNVLRWRRQREHHSRYCVSVRAQWSRGAGISLVTWWGCVRVSSVSRRLRSSMERASAAQWHVFWIVLDRAVMRSWGTLHRSAICWMATREECNRKIMHMSRIIVILWKGSGSDHHLHLRRHPHVSIVSMLFRRGLPLGL